MKKRPTQGFTLIEMVVILLIAGILAVSVVPRFTGRSAYSARAFQDRASNALRYGARLAIASGCSVTVILSASAPPSLSVQQPANNTCTGSQPVPAPSGAGSYGYTADSGVTLSGGATVTFTPRATATVSGFPITVSGGGFSGTLNVVPATAYVQATP